MQHGCDVQFWEASQLLDDNIDNVDYDKKSYIRDWLAKHLSPDDVETT